LESTKFLKEGKKYEECVNQASAVPQKSRFYADAQNLLNECQFFCPGSEEADQTYKTRTKMRELRLTKPAVVFAPQLSSSLVSVKSLTGDKRVKLCQIKVTCGDLRR